MILPLAVALTSCESAEETAAYVAPAADYAEVEVFWGTDRRLTGTSEPATMFGGDRGEFIYGTSIVSIPNDHEIGELEAPPSILRLKFSEDPSEHVMLLSSETANKDSWFDRLRSEVEASGRETAFVFIHGYNVTFEDAARRTAQIAYDLQYPGPPILYSWPSRGSTTAYMIDETNVTWSRSHLVAFLQDLQARSGASSIDIIAHSMGARLLASAFESLAERAPPDSAPFFGEVVLAAPDIDADVFKRDIVPAMAQLSAGRTLYASSEDRALQASRTVHGAPRAGSSGDDLVVMAGLETIDATGADTSFLGHSSYTRESILSDMFYLVTYDQRASQRFRLRQMSSPAGVYWKYRR